MEKNKLLLLLIFSVAIWNTVSILCNITGKVCLIIKFKGKCKMYTSAQCK